MSDCTVSVKAHTRKCPPGHTGGAKKGRGAGKRSAATRKRYAHEGATQIAINKLKGASQLSKLGKRLGATLT